MTPGAVVGNIEVVAPSLRLVLATAICPDPVAVLAHPTHKSSLAFLLLLLLLLLLDLCFPCSNTFVLAEKRATLTG